MILQGVRFCVRENAGIGKCVRRDCKNRRCANMRLEEGMLCIRDAEADDSAQLVKW